MSMACEETVADVHNSLEPSRARAKPLAFGPALCYKAEAPSVRTIL